MKPTRTLYRSFAAAVLALGSWHASASDIFGLEQLSLLQPTVIYGVDNRTYLYEVQNATFKYLAQSTAALFQSNQVLVNGTQAKLETTLHGEAMGLCETEPYYKQPSGAFCSGSLVGSDLFMTAGHCVSSQAECEDISFVFGFAMESANAYLANAHPDCLHDCLFLVCDACGRATHVDDDQLSARIRETARATGFRPDKPVIEVRGKCGDCA